MAAEAEAAAAVVTAPAQAHLEVFTERAAARVANLLADHLAVQQAVKD